MCNRCEGFNGKHSSNFKLSKNSEKRFKQNSEEFEVSCFDYADVEIGSITGGYLWTNGEAWYCHQVQIQVCKNVIDGKSTWSLAKIFTIENW